MMAINPNMPARIWATLNGMSTRLPDGKRQFVGGWSEDPERDRAAEFVRADQLKQAIEALRFVADAANPDDPENHRSDDREGCLDAIHATARGALAKLKEIGL